MSRQPKASDAFGRLLPRKGFKTGAIGQKVKIMLFSERFRGFGLKKVATGEWVSEKSEGRLRSVSVKFVICTFDEGDVGWFTTISSPGSPEGNSDSDEFFLGQGDLWFSNYLGYAVRVVDPEEEPVSVKACLNVTVDGCGEREEEYYGEEF